MIFYNLMTFDAAAMLDYTIRRQREANPDCRPEFRYDFHEHTTKSLILKGIDPHADNALFYQLIAAQYGGDFTDQYRSQKDCIMRSLIYLDFKDAFPPFKDIRNRYSFVDWNEEDIDAIRAVIFKDGFSIVYEDGEVKTYIPFDKSGNMSRHYSITFVDKDLFPKIDERLRLGIDFSSINVVLSKYYAYRGLYLTDGVRASDSDHVLDHNTVLVIDDDTHDFMRNDEVQNVPVITADTDQKGNFESVEKEQPVRLNSFDGEGLVSPAYAGYMNRCRGQEVYMPQPGVSFQIRMPFIKGMLHQVDFHQFFKEQLPENDYYIKDIFGIPRRIADVQIVLTKSMFKCAGWLKDYCKQHREIEDPMKWFFEKFHDYDHALYVCSTDSNMGKPTVSLTYQFLNTMDITPENLENLIIRHLNEAHSITATGEKYAVDLADSHSAEYFEDEDFTSSIPAWRHALALNPDFVRDRYVRSMLEMDEISRVKDICLGRIIVEGTLKYLSGDLLALLIHMIYNKKAEKDGGIGAENGLGVITEEGFIIDTELNNAAVIRLQKQLIRTGKFYTSDHKRLGLRSDRRYSILRSPHLSRNEQCSLRAYIPKEEDENNIYNRYFSDLKNVIMFPYESIDALSLGGADYDGDKVKLILNSTVNSAILKGSYILEGKDYVRKLPIVEIPSLGANSEPAPETIPYQLVKKTFSNQVGLISDLAIRLGKMEYGSSTPDPKLHNKCAECTLATGLEIDAAKTGVRPPLGTLMGCSPSGSDCFLDCEDIVKDMQPVKIKGLKVDVITQKDKSKYGGEIFIAKRQVYINNQYKKLFQAELIPLDAPAPVIDRLPGYFLKDLTEYPKKGSAPDSEGKRNKLVLFKFQVDEATGVPDDDWSNKLDQAKKNNTLALIKSYNRIESDARYIREMRDKASRSTNLNKIWFLAEKIFGDRTEELPVTHTKISDAIEIAYNNIRDIFETEKEVQDAIKRMKDFDWSFALSEEREELLCRILGTNSDSLSEETKEILLSDEQDAFYFLIYYLQEVNNEMILESSPDEEELKARKAAKYLEGYNKDDYEVFIHEYLAGVNNKESKRLWNARIINYCRDKLAAEDMFNNDFDQALKYCYACRSSDPNRSFLWEVFKTSEIIRNVYIKPRE